MRSRRDHHRRAGSIEQCILTPAIPDSTSLTHYIDVRGLLAAAELLYGRAPETVLFTVSGGSFDAGETLDARRRGLRCLICWRRSGRLCYHSPAPQTI